MALRPENEKALSGLAAKPNQRDRNDYFDGIDGSSISRKHADYENQFLKASGVKNPAAEDRANYGSGGRVGNQAAPAMTFRGQGNPTAERTKQPPATAKDSKNNTTLGGAQREYPADPDRINAGNTGGRKTRTFLK